MSDFCMLGVFTDREYWKWAQHRGKVCKMAQLPIWLCHSAKKSTARVENSISLVDLLTVPGAISNTFTMTVASHGRSNQP